LNMAKKTKMLYKINVPKELSYDYTGRAAPIIDVVPSAEIVLAEQNSLQDKEYGKYAKKAYNFTIQQPQHLLLESAIQFIISREKKDTEAELPASVMRQETKTEYSSAFSVATVRINKAPGPIKTLAVPIGYKVIDCLRLAAIDPVEPVSSILIDGKAIKMEELKSLVVTASCGIIIASPVTGHYTVLYVTLTDERRRKLKHNHHLTKYQRKQTYEKVYKI